MGLIGINPDLRTPTLAAMIAASTWGLISGT